uniref:Putative ovule protein n=1 Tax=Solanum chacoense TaxID=4108 RepID=A0A0V0HNF0_SOLCH
MTKDYVLLAYICPDVTSLLHKKTYISRNLLNLVNICCFRVNSLPYRSWMHMLLVSIYHFKRERKVRLSRNK